MSSLIRGLALLYAHFGECRSPADRNMLPMARNRHSALTLAGEALKVVEVLSRTVPAESFGDETCLHLLRAAIKGLMFLFDDTWRHLPAQWGFGLEDLGLL